jgi:hypothetical protein
VCACLSWRWCIAAAVDGDKPVLQLQALPVGGGHIKGDPSYNKDNLAVVVLASYPVTMEGFDGDLAAGPVPVLFSNKPEETMTKLTGHLQVQNPLELFPKYFNSYA